MPDVIGVRGPISFHFREEVSLKDPLRFANRCFNRAGLLRVQLAVIGPVEVVET